MADNGAITDFFLQLGFDATKIEKGLNQLEGKLDKFGKTVSKKAEAAAKKSNKAGDDENRILAKQLELRKKLYKIKKQGGDPSVMGLYNTARSKNMTKLQSGVVKANEILHLQEKLIAKEKDKAAIAAERVAKAEAAAAKSKKIIADAEKEAYKENTARQKHKDTLAKAEVQAYKEADRRRKSSEAADKKAVANQLREKKRASSAAYSADALNARRIATKSSVMKVGRRITRTGAQYGISQDPKNMAVMQGLQSRISDLSSRAGTVQSKTEFANLRREISKLNDETTQFIVKNRNLQKELTISARAAKGFKDSLNNLGRSYVSVFAAIGGAGAGTMVGQELVALKTTLLAVTDTAEEAAQTFDFISRSSLSMGVDLATSTRSFAQLGVAAKQAGLTVDQTKEIFLGMSEASAAFGMSSVDQERAFRALTQMMSKNQVMAEELKGQLSESLPSAIAISANALGVTTQELMKMMENGELVATEFLPKFTEELRKTVREGGALEAGLKTSRVAMQRFGTSFKLNILDSFESGLESGMSRFFNLLTTLTEQSAPMFRVIGKGLGMILETIGVMTLSAKQLIRPITILFDTIFVGARDGEKQVGFLTRAFSFLAAVILYPVAKLEQFNDYLEKASTTMQAFGTVASAAITWASTGLAFLGLKALGVNATVGKLITGFGLINMLIKGSGKLLMGVFSILKNHPLLRMISGLMLAYDLIRNSGDEGVTQQISKQNFGETSGLGKWVADLITSIQLAPNRLAGWAWGDSAGAEEALRRSAGMPSSSQTTNTIGKVDINISGAGDPQGVAEIIKVELDRVFQGGM